MRFVSPGGPCDWGLLDPEARVVRHLAGPLSAWAPRVAFGEGWPALPLNGQRQAWRATEGFELGRHFRRRFGACGDAKPGRIAAVMGAAPMGASNPVRCVVGYVEALAAGEQSPAFGPVMLTPDEFGPPGAAQDIPILDQLLAVDRLHGLRTGDVVVLGAAVLPPPLWAALRDEGAETRDNPSIPGPCSLAADPGRRLDRAAGAFAR